MHFVLLTALLTSILYGGYWLIASFMGDGINVSAVIDEDLRALALAIF